MNTLIFPLNVSFRRTVSKRARSNEDDEAIVTTAVLHRNNCLDSAAYGSRPFAKKRISADVAMAKITAVSQPVSTSSAAVATNNGESNDRESNIGNEENLYGENVLYVDGLQSINVSCNNGTMRSVYTRVTLHVPWTPTLYVSVRSDYMLQIRRDVNFALLLHGQGAVTTRSYVPLAGLTRDNDNVLWRKLRDMRLMEFQFSTFYARALARRYLADNATAHSMDYQLFAVDDAAFNVALSTYVNDKAVAHGRVFEDNDDSTSERTIDLNAMFQMCSWCKIEPNRGNYVKRLNDEELRLGYLSANPLTELPVFSYDIETVARNENILPRGVESDQRLSSLALTKHLPVDDAVIHCGAQAFEHIALAYAPLQTRSAEQREQRLTDYERKLAARGLRVTLFDNELDLLLYAVDMLSKNLFLVDMYGLDDEQDAERIACVLIGYNSYEYDHLFLAIRLIFYGVYEPAFRLLSTYPREPRFADTQISFDLLKHVIARYRAQVGSVSLSNVARFFYATDRAENSMTAAQRHCKMKFDSVSIRRLYFDTFAGEERFDVARALDGNLDEHAGLNLLRVLRYNVQDCAAVYYLYANIAFLENVVAYARHFFVGLIEASYVGNNRLLCNAFSVRALQDSNTVVAYTPSQWGTVTLLRQPAASERTRDTRYTPHELLQLEIRRAVSDEPEIMRIGKKAYIGGINSALSGIFTGAIIEADYFSFYPTQALANNGSKETVRVYTVHQLVHDLADGDVESIDAAIADGLLRVYEYEPDATNVRLFRDESYLDDRIDDDVVSLSGSATTNARESVCNDDWSLLAKRRQLERERQCCLTLTHDATDEATTTLGGGGGGGGGDDDGSDDDDDSRRRPRERIIHGIDSLARDTLTANGGWYEGVEFSCAREILDSSRDIHRRRVIVTRAPFDANEQPFLCSLWRYYLNERAVHKRKMSEAQRVGDAVKHRFHSSQQLIYKMIANTMYGVLNFEQNVMYSPAVAALITLMSRKTFHESTTIVERYFPAILDERRRTAAAATTTEATIGAERRKAADRGDDSSEPTRCRVVYRDTDGMIVCANRALSAADAKLMINTVNERLHATRDTISGYHLRLELEDAHLRSCTIMGKKKYWKAQSARGSFVTKGFEKNAQPFVKYTVRLLQRNFQRVLERTQLREYPAFRLAVLDPKAFFVAMFESLHAYYLLHGLDDFVFSVALNPRCGDSELARFIQSMLRDLDYDVGDRAPCVYVLDTNDPNETRFCTRRDFNAAFDRLNYLKCVRRFATYLLQAIEGFKRHGGDKEDEDAGINDADLAAWRKRFAMPGRAFETCLLEAYTEWLALTDPDAQPSGCERESPVVAKSPTSLLNKYRCLFRDTENDGDVATTDDRDEELESMLRDHMEVKQLSIWADTARMY